MRLSGPFPGADLPWAGPRKLDRWLRETPTPNMAAWPGVNDGERTVAEARRGIGAWLAFYNDERPHQALDYRTPFEVYAGVPSCGYVENARKSVYHIPTGTTATRKGLHK